MRKPTGTNLHLIVLCLVEVPGLSQQPSKVPRFNSTSRAYCQCVACFRWWPGRCTHWSKRRKSCFTSTTTPELYGLAGNVSQPIRKVTSAQHCDLDRGQQRYVKGTEQGFPKLTRWSDVAWQLWTIPFSIVHSLQREDSNRHNIIRLRTLIIGDLLQALGCRCRI